MAALDVVPFCVVSGPCKSSSWSVNLERHWALCQSHTPIATTLAEDVPSAEPIPIAYRGRVADSFLVPRTFVRGHYIKGGAPYNQNVQGSSVESTVGAAALDIDTGGNGAEALTSDNTAADIIVAAIAGYEDEDGVVADDDDDDDGDDGNVYGGYGVDSVNRDVGYDANGDADDGYDGSIFNLACHMYLFDWHCKYQTSETNVNGACTWSGGKCTGKHTVVEGDVVGAGAAGNIDQDNSGNDPYAEHAENHDADYDDYEDSLYNLACPKYLIDWHCKYQTIYTNMNGACVWSDGACTAAPAAAIDSANAADSVDRSGTTHPPRPKPYNAESYAAESRKIAKKKQYDHGKHKKGKPAKHLSLLATNRKGYTTYAAFVVGGIVFVVGFVTARAQRSTDGSMECSPWPVQADMKANTQIEELDPDDDDDMFSHRRETFLKETDQLISKSKSPQRNVP